MLAVYKKELRGYFCSMTGYFVIALMVLICGIFGTYYNFTAGYPDFEYVLYSVNFIFLILVPLLTMRSFADEKLQKTDQLLFSLPLKISNIVIGKFLAMLTIYAIPMVLMCTYPPILSIYGKVNFLKSYACIFVYFLVGAALIAIGMFISTLTESTLISAVLTFGALLCVYLMTDIASMIPSTAIGSLISYIILALILAIVIYVLTKNYAVSFSVGIVLLAALIVLYIVKADIFESSIQNVLNNISVFAVFLKFVNGIFSVSGIIYLLTVIVLFVFFSIQSLEKRRWS